MDWTLVLVFATGATVASLANAAVYEWAWNHRLVSPWQRTPEGIARRRWFDRLPIVGWLTLRRDAAILGRGFWVRPMLVEVAFGAALAALWWWEVDRLGLVRGQLEPMGIAPGLNLDAARGAALAGFALHAVLAGWMLIATLIDCDEKTIPDEVTVPGTLLGLALVALLPMGLMPNVEQRYAPPAGDHRVLFDASSQDAGLLTLEPTHLAGPDEWPTSLSGRPDRTGLVVGLGCYWLFVFALAPRVWRSRGGFVRGLAILLRRVARSLTTSPLREMLIAGTLLIAMAWFAGGAAWQGLLTAVVGMAVSGCVVWAVRIVASTALGKEAMGFGDVTLMMMIGAYLGWQAGLLVFFLAPFAGLVVGVAQWVLRRDDEIPYGPFLCLAASALVVAWADLWSRSEALFALGPVVPAVLVVCLVLLGVILAVWRWVKVRLLGMSEDSEEEARG
jgi:prepilin signal peptidase PulO-like enzyme (type II secretory pathway)